ncbi:DJ-1 family glyoxalase III [Anaerosacchariphilus polymeriproducens]|uniref:DJ-1/PfpI family protein n=1 Tax=Anaerosacchariphilus polymeriproducens TaxID=1812858 RepID=A0A371AUS7_9FIRM|nr:DJ-1 family glyoxalase III [Anaerosacchariphilus polymeriproducens]RDU23324.1 DJ-1/PfpI family protein [Anaerosacchariphilus polymeriproducens]
MKRVSVILADGFEEVEGLTVVDLLRRADIQTDMVSITKEKQIEGAHGIQITADTLFENVDFNEVDMLVLPGGMPGTLNLEAHKELNELLIKFAEEKKKLAAICAAPRVLGDLGLLNGKHAVCYPGNEERLEGAAVSQEKVEVDGNIITSRGVGTAIEFALTIIEVLKNKEEAARIKEAILY